MADAEACAQWRRQSAAHELAFQDALRVWRLVVAAATELAAETDVVPAAAASFDKTSRPLTRRAALGGMLAAASAAAGVLYMPRYGLLVPAADFATGAGGRKVVALTDRVTLDMNTRTGLSWVSQNASAPVVRLQKGEAVFGSRMRNVGPLTVLAKDSRIEAAAATFDVCALDGRVAVSCMDGVVRVSASGGTREVPAGMQLAVDATGLKTMRAFDREPLVAWQRGLIVFRRRPLSEVVGELNRYWPGRIVLLDAELGSRQVSGVFHLNRLDGVFDQMEKLGADIRRLPGDIVLIS